MAQKKHPRRKPGTGTIRHKKARAFPWEAAFPIGHNQHRYDAFATWEEATTHLDQLTKERDSAEMPRNVTGGSQRTDVFLTTWLNIKHPHVKEKTWLGYQYLCALAVAEIGTQRIDEVSRECADSLLAYFHRRGFKNVSQMRAVLRQAFQYALDEGYIKRNPFQRAKAPPVERRKGIALSAAQLARLYAVMCELPLFGLFQLYSRVGLRRGEGLALLWSSVDLEAGTIRITRHYVEVGSRNEYSTPKSKRSTREIPIPLDLVDLLKAHRAWQRRYAAGRADWEEHGLVFPSERGTPIGPRNLVRTFKALLHRAGLPEEIRIHDLRHTAEYRLETAGVPESARMALLGHSTPGMARHYANHADMEAMRIAVAMTA